MIQVDHLTKYYGENTAIEDLSFSIAQGEVVGFLGLNGAGKSTTLRILGCVLLPSSGHVVVDGFDLAKDPFEIRKRIGFLPDTPPLYNEMTVGGYLAFVAQLRGVHSKAAFARVHEAEEKTGLVQHHQSAISSLSHGYRQRVGLAQAIVHQPKLIILDEPTGGLDPVQIVEMRQLIRSLKGDHTVLVSSHILSEISQVCDRFLVIQKGRLVAQGTEAELAKNLRGTQRFELGVLTSADAASSLARKIDGITHLEALTSSNAETTLRIEASADIRAALVRVFVAEKIDVVKLVPSASQLENIFVQLTETSASESKP